MKTTIRDAAALNALRPLEVVSYLRASGWQQIAEKSGLSLTWSKSESKSDFEIVTPLVNTIRDYALRMSDVLQVLEVAEKRSQVDILNDLYVTSADVIRLRVIENSIEDGSVPLDEGTQFFQEAKNLMLAAACSAASPKPHYPTRKPMQAMEFLRKARLGQTEHGSYVLTIISRVSPNLTTPDGKLFETEEPFERKVTHTLASALNALRSSAADAASTGEVRSFLDAVPNGVSANLCDAIARMGGSSQSMRNLNFSFSWSRTRPLIQDTPILNEIVFSPDTFPVIEAAGILLKECSPRDEFDLQGAVVKLQRAEGAEKGTVTVHGFVDDLPRNVTFEIGEPGYSVAVDAHRDLRSVKCSGTLVKEGKGYRMINPTNLVMESGE